MTNHEEEKEPMQPRQDEPTEQPSEKEILQSALEAQQVQAAEYYDRYLRTAAEFDNYKKRQRQEQVLRDERTKASLISELLPVLDDLDRALESIPEQAQDAGWTGGIELVRRKLVAILNKFGVSEIEVEIGQPFDPNQHEAMYIEPNDDYPENSVLGVLRTGYMIGERVLRATQVWISKPSASGGVEITD